uniref:Fascin n=1 Tax=Pogona vitticeps TaxID=103695 RepID=A0ABM5GK17_9SAUR
MQIGLVNWTGGYLTGESYSDGVNVLGSSLGRKQTWELEVVAAEGKQTRVALIGHQGQRLLVDADGTVRCGRPASDHLSHLLLEVHPSGAWTLQQPDSKKYLESDGEDVFCVSRGLSSHQRWMPQLAVHAHVVLFHPSSRRYARADPDLNRVWVDASVPHLEECSFVLRFWSGACHLETSNHQFVSRSETLAEKPSAETAFQLTLRPGCLVVLADRGGRVLYPQGGRGLLCLGDSPEDHEEWFVIKRCPQWVTLKTRAKRYASVLGDSQVYAGSKKATPTSPFLFEVGPDAQTVQLKGVHHRYLAQRQGKRVAADGSREEPETRFQVSWHYGSIVLRALNGCYLGTLPVGLVVARAEHPGPNEAFEVHLANRAFLVLRGQYGYVGSPAGHEILQCNVLEPDCVELLPCQRGVYHFQSRGKGFWSLTPERTLKAGGVVALNFCLEIRGNHRLAVLAPNGYYLRGDREGPLLADSEEVTAECLWEI